MGFLRLMAHAARHPVCAGGRSTPGGLGLLAMCHCLVPRLLWQPTCVHPAPSSKPPPHPTTLPAYARAGLHRYKLRLCFEVVDLAPALPAVVNHHEARAYANWLSAKQVGACLSWGGGAGGAGVPASGDVWWRSPGLCWGGWLGRAALRTLEACARRPQGHATCGSPGGALAGWRHTLLSPCAPLPQRLQGLRGDAALRLLTEPEHHRLRAIAKRDAEGRAAEDPGALQGVPLGSPVRPFFRRAACG